jgi:hypothetical protein
MKQYIYCIYHVATITINKLPPNLLTQGYTMVYKVADLVKAYSIPPTFVVNNDQNGVHLVLNGAERTWGPKGTKDMQVLGLEDKRLITMVVSSSATRDLLPPQIVFINRTTYKSLPPNNQGKTNYIKDDWDLTFSENHWSSLETTKKFFTNILLPYLQS